MSKSLTQHLKEQREARAITKEELRERALAATQGRWNSCENGPWGGHGFSVIPCDELEEWFSCESYVEYKDQVHPNRNGANNARYMEVACPSRILELLDEVSSKDRRIEEMEEMLAELAKGIPYNEFSGKGKITAKILVTPATERARQYLKDNRGKN